MIDMHDIDDLESVADDACGEEINLFLKKY